MGCGTPEYLLMSASRVRHVEELLRPAGGEGQEGVARPRRRRLGQSRRLLAGATLQIDAHAFSRSSGERHLKPEEIQGLPADQVYRLWKAFSLASIYDFEHHVRIGEALEYAGRPAADLHAAAAAFLARRRCGRTLARMRTLTALQAAKGRKCISARCSSTSSSGRSRSSPTRATPCSTRSAG